MSVLCLIFGIIVWAELLIGLYGCKGSGYITAFLCRPFHIEMPSMIVGIIVRAILIAIGSVGIAVFIMH